MSSSFKMFLTIGCFVLVLFSCAPGLYIPLSADAQKAGVLIEDLALGRSLYVRNCGSCHSLIAPNYLRPSEWNPMLTVMQQKAKVSNADIELIRSYLLARAKQ